MINAILSFLMFVIAVLAGAAKKLFVWAVVTAFLVVAGAVTAALLFYNALQ